MEMKSSTFTNIYSALYVGIYLSHFDKYKSTASHRRLNNTLENRINEMKENYII